MHINKYTAQRYCLAQRIIAYLEVVWLFLKGRGRS